MIQIDGLKPQFIITHEAWYGDAHDGQEISLLMPHPVQRYPGEPDYCDGKIRWHELSPCVYSPQLGIFDDSWAAVAAQTDLLLALATLDDKNASPERVAKLLLELGWEDVTPREMPE